MSTPANERWDGILRFFAQLRSLSKEARSSIQAPGPEDTQRQEQFLVAQSLMRLLDGEHDEADCIRVSGEFKSMPSHLFLEDLGPREAEAKRKPDTAAQELRDIETLHAFRAAMKKA